jgi:hypothetical protein
MTVDSAWLRPSLRQLVLAAALAMLPACSASLPQTSELAAAKPSAEASANPSRENAPEPQVGGSQRPSSAALPPDQRSAQARALTAGQPIKQFKSASVVLYANETGHDGQRVAVSSLPLPLPTGRLSADRTRIEIMTVAGVRWVSAAEIAGESSSADQTLAASRQPQRR